jgi:DNA-directed RNA polymerase subunit RPC12/RpoP
MVSNELFHSDAYETCPKCGSRFPASETWVVTSALGIFPDWGWWDFRVRCPKCRHTFLATEHRYFGILAPRGMRALLITLFLGLILTAIILNHV